MLTKVNYTHMKTLKLISGNRPRLSSSNIRPRAPSVANRPGIRQEMIGEAATRVTMRPLMMYNERYPLSKSKAMPIKCIRITMGASSRQGNQLILQDLTQIILLHSKRLDYVSTITEITTAAKLLVSYSLLSLNSMAVKRLYRKVAPQVHQHTFHQSATIQHRSRHRTNHKEA